MSQVAWFVWISVGFFGYGVSVGRWLEQKRKSEPIQNNEVGLTLAFMLVWLIFSIEKAAKVGWLPYSAGMADAIGIGYVITLVLSVFFIFRLVRQSRTGMIRNPKKHEGGSQNPHRLKQKSQMVNEQ